MGSMNIIMQYNINKNYIFKLDFTTSQKRIEKRFGFS